MQTLRVMMQFENALDTFEWCSHGQEGGRYCLAAGVPQREP